MPEEAKHASNNDVEHDPHPLDDESDDDEGGDVTYTAPLKGDIKPTHSRYDLNTLRPHELLYADNYTYKNSVYGQKRLCLGPDEPKKYLKFKNPISGQWQFYRQLGPIHGENSAPVRWENTIVPWLESDALKSNGFKFVRGKNEAKTTNVCSIMKVETCSSSCM